MPRLAVSLLASTLAVPVAAYAQVAPPAPPAPAVQQPPAVFPAGAKFAFVNLQFVIAESKMGKAGLEELRKVQEARDGQLQQLAKEITQLQEKFDKQRGLLSAEMLKTLEADIDTKRRRLQFDSETRDADLQRLGRDMLDTFSAKVIPVVDGIRKERGLLVVFGVRPQAGGLEVVVADPGLDLSAEVIKRLDAAK